MRSEGQPIAQDPEAQYGKILKVDLATGVGQVVSMGHRNPQGIVVLDDGRVLSIEHGPQGGDELNLIRQGANYGWPRESYGTTYRGTAIPDAVSYGRHETFDKPLISWVPSITASAMTVARGFDPAWEGDLLVGSLVDMSLHRVRLEHDRVAYSERIPVGSRVRDVMQHPDGRIVMWTDNEELIFLSSAPKTDEHAQLEDFLDDAPISDVTRERVRNAVDRCSECHSFAVGEDSRSPSLARVYSADIASTGYPNYSPALKAKSGRWTTENLRAFLSDPAEFAPGTSMPDPQLPDSMTRDALVDYLQRRRRDF
jgi:cytochrome c2